MRSPGTRPTPYKKTNKKLSFMRDDYEHLPIALTQDWTDYSHWAEETEEDRRLVGFLDWLSAQD